MSYRYLLFAFVALTSLQASVIGTSKPAQSITSERIAQLPANERQAWIAYLERSQKQMQADSNVLAAERANLATIPPLPKEGYGARSMPLDRDGTWYGSAEAHHIADVIVSFQTPAGGWSKNLDMSSELRAKGQSYAPTTSTNTPVPTTSILPTIPRGTTSARSTTMPLQPNSASSLRSRSQQ